MTCSRPQRTATGGLEPGTSRPKVLGFSTAPVRSTKLLWKHKGFIFAYRNKFVLINIACLIVLTINFEDLTP